MTFTLETLEVPHVPTLALGLRALVGEYYLNTTHEHTDELGCISGQQKPYALPSIEF